MQLRNPAADVYVPDATDQETALRRTTHMAVGAHQDDIPIMAYDGVLSCADRTDRWFLAVTVTDGAGSPRTGEYADLSDDEMREVRAGEERHAAVIGRYTAAIQLGYTSAVTTDMSSGDVVADLAETIGLATPGTMYTHSLTDKHDTHVATALRTIAAVRSLPEDRRPHRLYGCEVWRGLDWMADNDKILFDYTGAHDLFAALIAAYRSQISGGKRYDRATQGRWRANATFLASHQVDAAESVGLAMDLTPLIADPDADIADFVALHVGRLGEDIEARLSRLC